MPTISFTIEELELLETFVYGNLPIEKVSRPMRKVSRALNKFYNR
jgi:hypothetical protein